MVVTVAACLTDIISVPRQQPDSQATVPIALAPCPNTLLNCEAAIKQNDRRCSGSHRTSIRPSRRRGSGSPSPAGADESPATISANRDRALVVGISFARRPTATASPAQRTGTSTAAVARLQSTDVNS